MFIKIICILCLCLSSFAKFKISKTERKLYEIIHTLYNSQTNQTKYLKIQCKKKNLLSISISNQQQLDQMPHYNIYDLNFQYIQSQNSKLKFDECEQNAIIQINENQFALKISRNELKDQNTVFQLLDFQFSSKYIKIITKDYSTKWGFGERFQKSFHVNNGMWTIWNRDRPAQIDQGQISISKQTYGHQPLYLARNLFNKLFHLIYLKTTYAINVQVKNQDVTYHVTGGNIHFLIFLGFESPQKLIINYHNYIQPSHIPPFWGMGWHQCRWGYYDLKAIQNVIQNYKKNQLPLDTIWTDIDYMIGKQDFTIDQSKFPINQFRKIVQNINYIPIIDAGISLNTRFAIQRGKQLDIFIKNNQNNYYVGSVWPGQVYFVDFLHPNSTKYWIQMLDHLYQKINFSGIWLDMNQMSNFIGGMRQTIKQTYKIQHTQPLNSMTINLDATFYNSRSPDKRLFHQQVHAYYGHLQSRATFNFFYLKNKRPFIITRSNTVGTGKYAGHWTGDNRANWENLRLSISGNFLYQIFGMQMVGADICGFQGSTTQQLCSRWMQLGSLYPFSRNHNTIGAKNQEPYAFGSELLQTSKLSLNLRYAILKQYYSIFVKRKGFGSIYRPLFFQFPYDEQCYKTEIAEQQFLIDEFLMGIPILARYQQEKLGYFPQSQWYSLEGKVYKKRQKIINKLPSAPSLFIRSGFSLFMNVARVRTRDLDNNFTVKVGFKNEQNTDNHISQGFIMSIQDYENNTQITQCINNGCFYEFIFKIKMRQLLQIQWNFVGKKYLAQNIKINQINGYFINGQILHKKDLNFSVNRGSGNKEIKLSQQDYKN